MIDNDLTNPDKRTNNTRETTLTFKLPPLSSFNTQQNYASRDSSDLMLGQLQVTPERNVQSCVPAAGTEALPNM